MITLEQVQQLLNDKLTQFLNRNWDMKGKRIINAGQSVAQSDYVTRAELQQNISRTFFGTLSPDQRPKNPRNNDIFISSDFLHAYVYLSGWKRITPAGFVGWFDVAPGTGWHLCDGTAGVTYSKDDGTTGTKTMPTMNAKVVARFDSAYSGPIPTAATAPTLNNGVHTHPITVLTGAVQSGAGTTVVTSVTSPTGNNTAVTANADGHDKLMDGLPYYRL